MPDLEGLDRAVADTMHRGLLTVEEHREIHLRTPNDSSPHAHDERNHMGTHEHLED